MKWGIFYIKRNAKKKRIKNKRQVWGQSVQPSGESSENPQTKCANFMVCVTAGARLCNNMEKQNRPKCFVLMLIDLFILNCCINCRPWFLDQNVKRMQNRRSLQVFAPDCVGAICETKAKFSHLIQTPERRPAWRLNIYNVGEKNGKNQIFKTTSGLAATVLTSPGFWNRWYICSSLHVLIDTC